ncbi:hypothetical protein [Labrenzia sp. VG12]|uniref:hypothetical protein n=1 Tax=Labrenzia sp. VG12 TaxID=2021862 RepID=UPI0018DF4677|nr:hypothetical protein [Labrenzia sp. VG12]
MATLLLLPLLLAALLPQGYMPSVAEDGTFTVTLCTTDGLRTVTLDANGNEVPDAPADEDDPRAGHCLFASSSVLALLQSGPDLPDCHRGDTAFDHSGTRPASSGLLQPARRKSATGRHLNSVIPISNSV